MLLLQTKAVKGPDLEVSIEDDAEISGFFSRHAGRADNPDQIFKRTARLTLYNLIRYTPMAVRQRRLQGCRTFFYSSAIFKRTGKRSMRIFAYKTGCNKRTYMTQIGFVDYTMGPRSTVWAHCDCEYFKYNCEYVLAQLGASSNVFAWHQPPHIRNPNMLPGCCKHVLLIVDDALKRAKQYARLDKNKELDLKVDVEEQPDKTPEYDKNKGPERIPKPGLKPMGQPPK